MKDHIAYLKYVIRHKWYVFIACVKLGVPLHIAIMHDISKFSRQEWGDYVKAFYNKDGTRLDERGNITRAFHHHEKNNKHHWGYWIVNSGSKYERYLLQSHGNGYDLFIFDTYTYKAIDPVLDDTHENYIWLKNRKNELNETQDYQAIEMPDVYVREMIADWIGAGKAISGRGDPLTWYEKNKHSMLMTQMTRKEIERILYEEMRLSE